MSDATYNCKTHGDWNPVREAACPSCMVESRRVIRNLRDDRQTLLWALQMVSVSLPHTDEMQELQNEVNVVIERFNQRATI